MNRISFRNDTDISWNCCYLQRLSIFIYCEILECYVFGNTFDIFFKLNVIAVLLSRIRNAFIPRNKCKLAVTVNGFQEKKTVHTTRNICYGYMPVVTLNQVRADQLVFPIVRDHSFFPVTRFGEPVSLAIWFLHEYHNQRRVTRFFPIRSRDKICTSEEGKKIIGISSL